MIAFSRRRKSLRHKGNLTVEQLADDEQRWVRLTFSRAYGPRVTVEVVDNQVAHVFVDSKRRQDRGKILLRLDGLRLTRNHKVIVAAIETTFCEADYAVEALQQLKKVWGPAMLRVLSPTNP